MRVRDAALAGQILLMVLLAACGGGGSSGGTNNDSPPTVSLNLASSAVRVGDTTTLSWQSGGATSCTGSGAWGGSEATSGSISITPSQAGSSTYSLSCTGPGGTVTESAVLTVAAALQAATIPGLPATVPLASGSCVPSSTSDYAVTCVGSAAAVPAQYATFSSTLATEVQQVGNNTPTVYSGTTCSGGFDSSSGDFAVSSDVGNDAIAFTGATVMEVVYSPSFVASLNLGFTSLSALVVSDNSNTDHFMVIVVGSSPTGAYALAMIGTVATDTTPSNIDVLECQNASQPAPPPPPPAGLTCAQQTGSGTNGLGWASQTLSYQISTTAADQQSSVSLGWGVQYDNPQLASDAYTGSLRAQLWALPYSYQLPFQGYLIANAYPDFSGAAARSSNQLYNFNSWTGIVSAETGANPPAGSYCMVLVLEEYDPNPQDCSAADHYCVVDFSQFSPAQSFQ